jgi:uncharacterized protein (DUF2235 family)
MQNRAKPSGLRSGDFRTGEPMPKNIIVCSDGTGNAFKERATNVSALIKSIDLRGGATGGQPLQVAFYDQGVGTNPSLVADAKAYSRSRPEAEMLAVLPEPNVDRHMPGLWARLRGLIDGYGLDRNIKEMVRALADVHQAGDRLYLFGFSRGAFTVRAVAGFVHRCGLPAPGEWFERWFTDAFDLYTIHFPPAEDVEAFRRRSRSIEVDFLGLWDTVKSYGGLRPISWPHLRHNPSVRVVRHALALDEQRAWFQHTTWGRTDEKLCGEPLEPDTRYATQKVEEVWFRGCHSDIGGGAKEESSARVALLWMLGEAAHFGLRLNDDGKAMFQRRADFNRPIEVHDSFPWWWPIVGAVPREELHNDCRPPRRTCVRGSRSARDPTLPHLLGGHPREFMMHVSAAPSDCPPHIKKIETRDLPEVDPVSPSRAVPAPGS